MRITHSAFILTCVLIAAGDHALIGQQQKYGVTVQAAKTEELAKAKTYSWTAGQPSFDKTVDAQIVAAVDRELARRGFTQTDNKEAADVLVAYFAALTVGFSRTYLGEYYGYVTGWGSPIPPGFAPTTSSTIYEQGAIVIDVVDRAANRAIWRGVARTRVHQDTKLATRIERINDAAERMFQKFPIRTRK